MRSRVDRLNNRISVDSLPGGGARPNRQAGEILVHLLALLDELVGKPIADDPVFEDFDLVRLNVELFAKIAPPVRLTRIGPYSDFIAVGADEN